MAFMPWSEHFVTAIEFVDRQHRGLVDLRTTIALLLASGEATLRADAAAGKAGGTP
ncbi:hypothetical protein ACCAA_670006 [Candidatus Accumulibacter aalborgensis]|uniref:Uncharacterized protein n=1 Tax=Candidatus Accumulibacter aalborgensis TaxID=1860102 RepID=A0A1A8XVM3_9PROT|nr:hypothetical protein [Candidatus Accumulibacter aalborgensis]SBT09064.1 hypothetical protein ACCAA_670006 [Candidatus Accumulibacter aalborgensis]